MKLVETSIGGAFVRLRFADDPNRDQSSSWIDIQVPLSDLKNQKNERLTDLDMQYLGEVRLAALQYARAIIGAENQRLSGLAGRNSQ